MTGPATATFLRPGAEARYRAAETRLWDSHGMRPREQLLPLGRLGGTVRVQEVGAGPPVLFIHGANTSGASWVALAARLPEFRCLLLDRPGTGLSPPVAGRLDRSDVEQAGDTLVVDVLDALELDRAHVVATSLGGYFGLRSAAAHPARIGRMVQFSWPVGAPTTWIPWLMRVNGVPGMGRLMAALPASERSARMTFRQIGHGPSLADGRITREDLDCYVAILRHTRTLREDARISRVFVSVVNGLNRALLPSELLRRVVAPTHFLWGERDPFGGPDTARLLVDAIPHASLEILADAGHAPWLDQLERCAAAVRDRLGRGAP